MFKHILVPVDGSPTSLSAVGTAAAMAAAFGASITAIYVIDPYPFTGVGADFAYGQDQYLKAAHAEADSALGAVTSRLDGSGTVVNTRIIESHTPWRGILDAVEEANALLSKLVIGKRFDEIGTDEFNKLVEDFAEYSKNFDCSDYAA